jgi:hypothetical protein
MKTIKLNRRLEPLEKQLTIEPIILPMPDAEQRRSPFQSS